MRSIVDIENKALAICDANILLAAGAGTPGEDKKGNKGVWVTVKGGPLFIRKGESSKDAMGRREESRKGAGGFFARRRQRKEEKSAFKKARDKRGMERMDARIIEGQKKHAIEQRKKWQKNPAIIQKTIDSIFAEKDVSTRGGLVAELGGFHGNKEAKSTLQKILKTEKEIEVKFFAKWGLKRLESKDGSLSVKENDEFHEKSRTIAGQQFA